ncbi:MAG: hypothetical protein INR69_02710 [Mucilaginibacter polytrichastri]|nr:hypothetical protein [Mucilaginibacter polytrichastri]
MSTILAEKDKQELQSFAGLLSTVFIWISFFLIDTNPVLAVFFIALWLSFWIPNLYMKIRYRMGLRDHIRVATPDDRNIRNVLIGTGVLLFAGSLLYTLWLHEKGFMPAAWMLIGIVVFLNGFFNLPESRLVVSGNRIYISGLPHGIDLRRLRAVQIAPDRITLTTVMDEEIVAGHLHISRKGSARIKRYLENTIATNKVNILVERSPS